MGGTLLRRRGHRRLSPGLPGRERLRPAGFGPADHVARLRAAASKGGGADAFTLDDVIADAWRALSESETAQCPLCGGEMRRGGKAARSHGAGEELHGECVDCGTQLLSLRLHGEPSRPSRAKLNAQVKQPRRSASEESPDITGQGGRAIDPGKPAGKCHRNKPPTPAVPRERPAGKGEMVR